MGTVGIEYITYVGSLAFQAVSIVLGIVSLAASHGRFSSNEKKRIVYESLVVETVVNFIQLGWYIGSYYFRPRSGVWRMPATRTRYVDWALTTPLMLVSLVALCEYDDAEGAESLRDLFSVRGLELTTIILSNASMLLFGLLSTYVDNPHRSRLIWCGFLPFFETWVVIFWSFWQRSGGLGKASLILTFVTWASYGIAAHFSRKIQSVSYNILDTIAKNVYSIVLSIILF